MPPPPQIRIDLSSEVTAYRQVTDQLRALAVEGLLRPGDSLPPVRRLAVELGVHFNTIAEAYRTLAEEGFVEIIHGHGARIVDRTLPRHVEPQCLDNFRQRLRELIAAVRARGASNAQLTAELRLAVQALEKH
jgi:GntR family transcriptional regulator